jgi:hypothetical protein
MRQPSPPRPRRPRRAPTQTRTRGGFAARCLAACVLAATAARAQAPGGDEGPKAAEALFLDGREAMRAGDFATACPKFAESQRLDPSLGTLLNLSLCEESLGDLVNARVHLRAFVDGAPPSDDRIAAASEHLEALERRLPRLELRLAPDASPLTRIALDGAPLATPVGGAPASVALNPGPHELFAQAPGGPPLRQALRLDEGQVLTYVVRPAPAALSPDAEPGAPAPAPLKRTLGFVGLGIGAAGLATSAVVGGLLLERKAFIERHCEDKRCDDPGFGAVGQAQTLSAVGTASFAVGVVGLAAGAYLLITSPKAAGPRPRPMRNGLAFTYTF